MREIDLAPSQIKNSRPQRRDPRVGGPRDAAQSGKVAFRLFLNDRQWQSENPTRLEKACVPSC